MRSWTENGTSMTNQRGGRGDRPGPPRRFWPTLDTPRLQYHDETDSHDRIQARSLAAHQRRIARLGGCRGVQRRASWNPAPRAAAAGGRDHPPRPRPPPRPDGGGRPSVDREERATPGTPRPPPP